jgi:hypothetical protein
LKWFHKPIFVGKEENNKDLNREILLSIACLAKKKIKEKPLTDSKNKEGNRKTLQIVNEENRLEQDRGLFTQEFLQLGPGQCSQQSSMALYYLENRIRDLAYLR